MAVADIRYTSFMCFVLFAGTSAPLPARPWRDDAPAVSVQEMSGDEQAVKAHFTQKIVQFVGSTSRCGCDFPNAALQTWRSAGFELNLLPETTESERLNAEELMKLLRETGEKIVEIYGVWYGDFFDAPEARETISLSSILDPYFRFKEKAFYTIHVD